MLRGIDNLIKFTKDKLKIDLNGLQSLIEAKPMLIKFYQILVENIIRIMKSTRL